MPEPIDTKQGFGHKGCKQTMVMGNFFDHKTESGHFICGGYRIVIAKINFVLTGRHFMVGCFNIKTHINKGFNNIATGFFGLIHGGHIKVSTLIVGIETNFAIMAG
jgi:hypothetical protein